MYLLGVIFCVGLLFWSVYRMALLILEELKDRSPGVSNQSGNALIAILAVGVIICISLAGFVAAKYMHHR